jgi:hypothetical protein
VVSKSSNPALAASLRMPRRPIIFKPRFFPRVIQENDHPVAIGCLGKFQDIMDGLFVAAL